MLFFLFVFVCEGGDSDDYDDYNGDNDDENDKDYYDDGYQFDEKMEHLFDKHGNLNDYVGDVGNNDQAFTNTKYGHGHRGGMPFAKFPYQQWQSKPMYKKCKACGLSMKNDPKIPKQCCKKCLQRQAK